MTRKKIKNLFGDVVWGDSKFATRDNPADNWRQMPSFDPKPISFIDIKFIVNNSSDEKKLKELLGQEDGQQSSPYADSVWFPHKSKNSYSSVRVKSSQNIEMKYPIYIPSKGRWKKRLTSDSLIRMKIKHYMIVEESQYENYKSSVDDNWVTLLILPQEFVDNYETCDELDSTVSKGSGPARNFAWSHAISQGFKRHWLIDDNINHFFRYVKNKRIIVSDCAILRAMEDHADQYTNVAMSGPHYRFFVIPGSKHESHTINTRIYSCNLILNDIEQRWRGRFNEDTILSLDILKAGYCTMIYKAFLIGKIVTQGMSGGNTELYKEIGTKIKSETLVNTHPDVSSVVMRYNRWHHFVNYEPFKNNRLVRAFDVPEGTNEYGMEIVYE